MQIIHEFIAFFLRLWNRIATSQQLQITLWQVKQRLNYIPAMLVIIIAQQFLIVLRIGIANFYRLNILQTFLKLSLGN